ncbi:hypothetical protein ACGRHY_29075 [Streptomyces sp. HK10]|uniref:hypothetical protein n=1 Tax=Streptomyces sp. HK10 TaxID=3373255 RepID=UPI0037481F5D
MPATVPEQPAPTLEAAIGFVSLHASQDDLDRIYAAAKQRTKVLREARAAAVTKGVTVRIDNIKPKYLSGLTGTVTDVSQSRTRTLVTVELDPESTTTLRMASARPIPDGVERYQLTGVPAACCHVQ